MRTRRADFARWGWRAAPLLLLAVASFFYLWRIGDGAGRPRARRIIIANDAYALATTGRTLGRRVSAAVFLRPLSEAGSCRRSLI